ncbi:MAG: hypothetical protein KF726_05135 [Anaerolineae bacterium]|nr:hypothetical protein [Anaerolineae bacterium]
MRRNLFFVDQCSLLSPLHSRLEELIRPRSIQDAGTGGGTPLAWDKDEYRDLSRGSAGLK